MTESFIPLTSQEPQTAEGWKMREWEVADLFSPAAPINEASLIAGRQSQIERLTDAVFERGRHAILFGERGVGKTSVANNFHAAFAGTIKTITSIRKPAFPGDDYSSLWRRVFAEISVDGRRVSEFYPGTINPDDVVREISGFSLNTYPIIILDEFDKLGDPAAKRLTAHTIKALSDDRTSNATVVIVGVAEDVTALIDEHASVSRNITEILMPRMSRTEMEQIIDQRYPKVGMSMSASAKASIVGLSRGLPEYVHFLARDAAREALRSRRLLVRKDDVAQAIANMMDAADQTAAESYDTAVSTNRKNTLYKQILLACAMTKPEDALGRFAPSDVLEPLKRVLHREIKIANFFPHIEAFCTTERGSILEKKGTRQAFKYRFREPKMQPYVLMRGIADKLIPSQDLLGT